MISKNSKEIRITLSNQQASWLDKTCQKAGISKSKYISWLLAKSAEEMLKILKSNTYWGNYTDEEIKEIIKTQWIK